MKIRSLCAFLLSIALVSQCPAARTFNGAARITATVTPGNVLDTARTISFFVVVTGVVANRQILYFEGTIGSNTQFVIELESSRFTWQNGNTEIKFGPNPVVADTLYHVAVTYGSPSGFAEGYVNGSAAGNLGGFGLATTSSGIGIGDASGGGGLPLTGVMSEVAKWNSWLNPEDIVALSKGISPLRVRPGILAFYAPLVRDIQDYKGLPLTDVSTTVSAHPRIYR